MSRERTGILLCVAAAAGFGVMGILGKVAYDHGAGVASLLSVRFALAAIGFWALAAALGRLRGWKPRRRTVLIALSLGAFGYSAQAGFYFSSIERIDVSLASLILYAYPALVTIAAVASGRDRIDAIRAVALAVATAGVALVMLGGGAGAIDTIGALLALGAAFVYTGFILVSHSESPREDPILFSALVLTGAALTTVGAAVATSASPAGFEASAWLAVGAIAIFSTVLPVLFFLIGLQRVGPSTASIVSTVEPVLTVTLAFVIFGERLAGLQLVGGLLVLAAVIAVQVRPARGTARARVDGAPA